MDLIGALILGVVQGITEFLPISSTGHLILARTMLGVSDENGLAFDALLHVATAGAVIVYFFPDIKVLVQSVLRMLSRLPVNKKDTTLIFALMVGTLPAVILGLLLEGYMNALFRNPLLVALVLVIGSILFMIAEYIYTKRPRENTMTTMTGFKIGLFQALALLPGMSRSGASIAGGMLLGLSRSEAARFAFLLAIPVILGGGAKKTLELMTSDAVVEWTSVLLGAGAAFIVGLFAIHFMITFVRNHTLWPFIWYRLILAGIVVFATLFA